MELKLFLMDDRRRIESEGHKGFYFFKLLGAINFIKSFSQKENVSRSRREPS